MKRKISKSEQQQLLVLAKAINEREEAILMIKNKTIEVAGSAVVEARLQGNDLLKAKEMLSHGSWLPWLESHCPRIGERQAQRYIRLAQKWSLNPSSRTDLDACTSIHEALEIFATPRTDATPPAEPMPAYLQTIQLFSRAMKFVTTQPMDVFPDEAKAKLRNELQPIVSRLWPEKFA